jgi:hypothetical protein
MRCRRAVRPAAAGLVAYTLLLREFGSVLNDATVWCPASITSGYSPDGADCRFIGNSAPYSMSRPTWGVHGGHRVRVTSVGARSAMFPAMTSPAALSALPCNVRGRRMLIARLGYSGETGYELVIADPAAAALWQALLEAGDAGLVECGFTLSTRSGSGRPHPVHARVCNAHDAVRRFSRPRISDRRAFYGARQCAPTAEGPATPPGGPTTGAGCRAEVGVPDLDEEAPS